MANELPHKGALRDIPLPAVLTIIQRHSLTGTLTLQRNDQSKSIYCRNGDIIFAVSKYPDDRLGEFLLKKGKITLRQYEESAAEVIALGKRQGSVLVERGYLAPRDLVWAITHQVQEIILSLFTWLEGEFQFEKDVLPSREVITLRMSTGSLIYQGIQRINDWVRLRQGLPGPDKVLRVNTDPLVLYQRVELTEEERKCLALVNGRRTILELFDDSELPPFETLKLIYFLVATDITEVTERPAEPEITEEVAQEPPSEVVEDILKTENEEEKEKSQDQILKTHRESKDQNHYQVLGIPVHATKIQIKQAYFRLSKVYHPDRHFSSGLGEMKEPLEQIFYRITQAYETLMNDELRKPYDFEVTKGKIMSARGREKEAPKAASLFAQGNAALKKGDVKTAAYFLEEALKLSPGNGTYHGLLGRALSQIKARRRDAEFHFKKAIKKDPYKIHYYTGLASLYEAAGLPQRAIRIFEEALMWDPDNQKIRDHIQQLNKRIKT